MKRLNKTESMRFVLLCILFPKASLQIFNLPFGISVIRESVRNTVILSQFLIIPLSTLIFGVCLATFIGELALIGGTWSLKYMKLRNVFTYRQKQ